MAKVKRKKVDVGIIVKIIFLLLAIVLLLGAFFAIKSLSNNFKNDIKTFYVTIDGKMLTENTSNVDLLDKQIRVYFLEDITNSTFDYRIVRNSAAADFDFSVDGQQHKFSEVEDCTVAFDITISDNLLTIHNTSIQDVLAHQYGGTIVLAPDSATSDCFELIITSSDGKHELRLGFSAAIAVDEVFITPSNIVF